MARVPVISKQSLYRLADRVEILRLVLAAGMVGIRSAVIAAQIGRSVQCVGGHLVELERDKLIERSIRTGNNCRWGAPGIWAQHQAARDREASRRERRRLKSGMPDPFLSPVSKTTVPAHLADPMRQRPSCSVWEFAARGGYG